MANVYVSGQNRFWTPDPDMVILADIVVSVPRLNWPSPMERSRTTRGLGRSPSTVIVYWKAVERGREEGREGGRTRGREGRKEGGREGGRERRREGEDEGGRRWNEGRGKYHQMHFKIAVAYATAHQTEEYLQSSSPRNRSKEQH